MAVTHLSYVTIALLVVTMTSFSIASVISVPSSSLNPVDRQNNPHHHHHHNHHHRNNKHHHRHHLQETAFSNAAESGISQDSNEDSSREGDVKSLERLQPPALDCPTEHFFSAEVSACLPCSGCPRNQIVRRPCSARADTWCTPFFEFNKFQLSPASAESSSQGRGDVSGAERERKGGEGSGGRRHHRKHEGHNNNHREGAMSPEVSRPEADLTAVSLARARSQWRTLSLALISVLAVVCVLVVVVGMYVCVVCRRSGAGQHKNLYREPELLSAPRHHLPAQDDDAEPRYVDTYITSRDRLRDARHLPVYQHLYAGSDDVQCEFPPLVAPSSSSKTTTKGGHTYFNIHATDDVSEA